MKTQRQGGFLMAKIRQVSGRLFEKMLKDYGIEINSAQGRVMFALWQNDEISINELAGKTHLKKSTLTSMLDRLEGMGYIKRQRCKEDRRKILIKRTNKDKMLESKYAQLSQEISKLYYKSFSKSQVERFESDLVKILDNLTEFEKEQNNNGAALTIKNQKS